VVFRFNEWIAGVYGINHITKAINRSMLLLKTDLAYRDNWKNFGVVSTQTILKWRSDNETKL
jgi:hypothetical protein